MMGIPILIGRGVTSATTRMRRRWSCSTTRRCGSTFRAKARSAGGSARVLEENAQLEIVGIVRDVEVQQRARQRAADDVCALPAESRWRHR